MRTIRRSPFFIALLTTLLLTGACLSDDDASTTGVPPTNTASATEIAGDLPIPWPNVPPAEIFEDLNAFVGKSVVVHGEVEEILSAYAFTIRDDETVMLVIGDDVGVGELSEGRFVRVRGAIRDFDIVEVEPDVGIELDEELLAPFNDQPVVVAERIMSAPITVEALLDSAGVFVGHTLTVVGQIEEVFNPTTFAIHTGDESVLVTGTLPEEVQTGTWVAALGIVQAVESDDVPITPESNLTIDDNVVAVFAEAIDAIAPPSMVTISEILDDPPQFAGEFVSISGPLGERLGSDAVSVEAERGLIDLLGGSILVVFAADNVLTDPLGEDFVIATGTVRIADALDSAFLVDLGLPDDVVEMILTEYENEPIVVAESISIIDAE